MGVIDIGTVLARFDDTYNEATNGVNEYRINFITADGRLRSMRCRKYVRSPQRSLRSPLEARGKQTFNLKKNATMLMHDLNIDEPRYVKIPMIFGFKQTDSEQLTVRH